MWIIGILVLVGVAIWFFKNTLKIGIGSPEVRAEIRRNMAMKGKWFAAVEQDKMKETYWKVVDISCTKSEMDGLPSWTAEIRKVALWDSGKYQVDDSSIDGDASINFIQEHFREALPEESKKLEKVLLAWIRVEDEKEAKEVAEDGKPKRTAGVKPSRRLLDTNDDQPTFQR